METLSLSKLIIKHLNDRPEDGPALLDAVSIGLKSYKEKVDVSRGNLAYNSIDKLFFFVTDPKAANKMTNEQKAVCVTDSIVHNFPKGYASIGSKIHDIILNQFCEWYFLNSHLYKSSWETDVKCISTYMEMLHDQFIKHKEMNNNDISA